MREQEGKRGSRVEKLGTGERAVRSSNLHDDGIYMYERIRDRARLYILAFNFAKRLTRVHRT
jgi:hypothetical protein